ncbi:MAG: hypothetical protein MMC33_003998 [Icmadophila ericetorum]|nr:hypothetical protein [Icmadophila ericetorum]
MARISPEEPLDQSNACRWLVRERSRYCGPGFRSARSLHYVSKIRKIDSNDINCNCSLEQCIGCQIDLKIYALLHYDLSCNCELVSIDDERLSSILKSGKFSLLKLDVDRGDLDYVALSHVWADGLGNPYANALLKCQLFNIKVRVRELFNAAKQDEISKNSDDLLWLDTLCVPSKFGEDKTTAITLMKNTFKRARHVLVLDASLKNHEVGSTDLLEAAVRIFTSPWLRRLWCLQEGALAERLWLQFQDRAVELQEVLNELSREFQSKNFNKWHVVLEVG